MADAIPTGRRENATTGIHVSRELKLKWRVEEKRLQLPVIGCSAPPPPPPTPYLDPQGCRHAKRITQRRNDISTT